MNEPTRAPHRRPAERALRAGLVLCAAVLFLAGLGRLDLWAPDEPRYAAVAEEMRSMRHGLSGLVLLRLNDEAYTQKPPLYYWLAALAGAPGDRVTEFAARLPSAAAGIAVLWLTMRLGLRLFGTEAALLAGAVLLTTPYFAHLARRAQLDILLALFELVALALFWSITSRGELQKGDRRRRVALMHAAMGLAVMTKGPVGFLIPSLVMVATLAWERRTRDLRGLFPAWGLLLSLGPGLAWIAAAIDLAPPGFFGEAVIENLFSRFFGEASHPRAFYYFAYQLPVIFLPWTLLAPLIWRTARRDVFAQAGHGAARPAWRFLLAWAGVTVLFFSISSGKRELYMMPAFPALALLCGDALDRALSVAPRPPRWLTGYAALLAVLATIGAAVFLAIDEVEGVALPPGIGLALLAIVAISGTLWLAVRRTGRTPRWSLGVLVVGAYLAQLFVFTAIFPSANEVKSVRAPALIAADLAGEGNPIGLLRSSPMVGGLAYYSGRHIVQLETAEGVQKFFVGGGRSVVCKDNKLRELKAFRGLDFEIKARTPYESREILVIAPAARTDREEEKNGH